MAKDLMGYNRMVEAALRGVVRQALARAAEQGLPGSHHFYLSFRTGDPGVQIADHLHQKFPNEMTIVIQHQYWGLELSDDAFEVTLSFNKVHERLRVPFSALTSFFDPSVQFGLQFQVDTAGAAAPSALPSAPADTKHIPATTEAKPSAEGASEKVVTLDQFRKK